MQTEALTHDLLTNGEKNEIIIIASKREKKMHTQNHAPIVGKKSGLQWLNIETRPSKIFVE